MTIDKAIYDKRETAKKLSKCIEEKYIARASNKLLKEKIKSQGLAKGGTIKDPTFNIYKKGGPVKPIQNGPTTLTSEDWDLIINSTDFPYELFDDDWMYNKSEIKTKPKKLVADATDEQHKEADRLWKLELKKMELDPYYLPEIIDPEDVKISKRKSIPRKLLAYKFGASSQQEEDLIGRHVDDWTNAINKGELDPSVDFMQYINMILGRDSVSRGGIISVI